MEIWVRIALATLPAAFLLLVVSVIIIRRCFFSKKQRIDIDNTRTRPERSLQSGIAKLHVVYETDDHKQNLANFQNEKHDLGNRTSMSYYVLRRGYSVKQLFNWADNPSLISEAVETGWARFAFTSTFMTSSPSTRSMFLGLCVSGDDGGEREANISWEVCPGSADFMQKIRLNPGLKRTNTNTPLGVIKTSLPLPGPPLENSFPQEAYFEITILSSQLEGTQGSNSVKEGERTKLIQQVVDVNAQVVLLDHVPSKNRVCESKLGNKEEGRTVAVGLTVGNSPPSKLPGSYYGSIGFYSNGSVYLDGIKLVSETQKAEWGTTEKVIGCGFDPRQRRVFFTVDLEVVHIINCKSKEFTSPLYPTLAANVDITVLVNLGQSTFKYDPANAHRTPNPCFVGSKGNDRDATLGYEDSRELFSMGRIDSQWLNRSTPKSSRNYNGSGDNASIDIYEESDGDLFEIVLDRRSPNTVY
ncbi:hypothetical protein GIB67_016318 [Kingdonia uniflora]|uniref:B30.2/SPRY domain-containing protein n=1 Tax=Kingdonia uniflora TaxID=39325 RepID=A0A7J7M9E5_9MAGN|nr:hypothetical protein GIB67_016318 [Kingdonia uniflora]